MADLRRFRGLSAREQAVVAIGVLLDGHDAIEYLSSDISRQSSLVKAARDLAELPVDLRMPLLGTLLRQSLSAVKNGD